MELEAVPASVGAARHAAGDLADRVGADRHAVELAVSEAVGNAVLHGFPHVPKGTVAVSAKAQPDGLLLTVSDDGVGMRPNPDGKGLGFGLPLMAQLARELEITARQGGGTVLRMRFNVGAEQ
jgi:stage II sporulation protein AB (anti-sigma F factor)